MATNVYDHEKIDRLKHIASTDDTSVCCKKFKFTIDCDSDSSGDIESIYSYQDHPTASAHDTTDTDEDEYEVRSLSEVTHSEASSGPEKCVLLGNLDSILRGNSIVDELYLADLSSSTSDVEETKTSSQKRCEKCKSECEEPFTLCLRCFRQRRTYLPPRPKSRKKNRTASSGYDRQGSQGSFAGSQGSFAGSQGSSTRSQGSVDSFDCHRTSQQGSSSEPRLNLCKCCFAGPIDGAFIHRDTVHSLYCYKCSMKQWRMRGRCPFCNQKLCKVAKIFPVEE